MSLHDLLDQVGRSAPPRDATRSAGAAWGVAARRRRRGRLGACAAGLGLVVAGLLVGISLDRPPVAAPAVGALEPGRGLPATIYSVKPWLPTIGSDPIPPIAYIVEESYLEAPVAISIDGTYRYLPSAPGAEGFTLTSFAVSRDGRQIALAWSGIGAEWTGGPVRAQVWAYDVTTGGRRGPWLGEGFGGAITDLVLRPDGEGFAWQETRTVTGVSDESSDVFAVRAMRWGYYSEEFVGARGPLAWSPDGSELLVNSLQGDARIVSPASRRSRVLDVPFGTEFGPAAWSTDGSHVAGLDAGTVGVDLVLVDPVSGLTSSNPLGEMFDAKILGWRTDQLVLARYGLSAFAVLPVDPATLAPARPLTTQDGLRSIESLTAAQGVLDSAPVVSLPRPDQSRLSWSYLQTRPVEVTLAGFLLVGLLSLVFAAIWRRSPRR